jgi:hypothetical protein
MNPNDNAVSAQTGQPTPYQQGASMNWRKLLKRIIRGVTFCCGCWITEFLLAKVHLLNIKFPTFDDFIRMVTAFVLFFIAVAGLDELSRGGHMKVRRMLRRWIIVLFFAPLVLVVAAVALELNGILHLKKYVWIHIIGNLYIPFTVLSFATLPLALYLNRRKKKSTSQQVSANES